MKQMQTIKLHYKQTGSGPVLIILHGLFGSLDNWQTMVKMLSDEFTVYSLDLRNHGKSPHTDDFSIRLMAGDVMQFIQDHQLADLNIIGHSMGGKVALELLNLEDTLLHKMMILDIAPKKYPNGHEQLFKAMFALDLNSMHSRKEAEEQMMPFIPDLGVRQFILKNLDRTKEGNFIWKVNLESVYKHYDEINKEISFRQKFMTDVLFVKGSLSRYILPEDETKIKQLLPNAKFVEIEGAGHWIHADKPDELMHVIKQFMQTTN